MSFPIEPITLTSALSNEFGDRLTLVAATIAYTLYCLYGEYGNNVFISEPALAKACYAKSKQTINSNKKLLRGLGLITWRPGSCKGNKGLSNTYDITGILNLVAKYSKKNQSNIHSGTSLTQHNNHTGGNRTQSSSCIDPAQNLDAKESSKRNENSSLSECHDDLSGDECRERFKSEDAFSQWIRAAFPADQSVDTSSQKIHHFWERMQQDKWTSRGSPIRSIKNIFRNWAFRTKCNPPQQHSRLNTFDF